MLATMSFTMMQIFFTLLFTLVLSYSSFSFSSHSSNSKIIKISKNINGLGLKKQNTRKGSCETSYILISYSNKKDYDLSCQGIKKTEAFFDAHIDYSSSIFKPLHIVFVTPDDSIKTSTQRILKNAAAFYIKEQSLIVAKPWEYVKNIENKKHTSLKMSEDIFISIIAHELSHHFHYQNIKNLSWDTSQAQKTISNIKELKKLVLNNKSVFQNTLDASKNKTISRFFSNVQLLKASPEPLIKKPLYELASLKVQWNSILKKNPLLKEDFEKAFDFIKINQILSSYRLELSKSSTEFFAVIVELETMNKKNKELFLKKAKDEFLEKRRKNLESNSNGLSQSLIEKKLKALPNIKLDTSYLNQIIYELKPNLFKLAAYEVYKENQEEHLLQKVFNGDKVNPLEGSP